MASGSRARSMAARERLRLPHAGPHDNQLSAPLHALKKLSRTALERAERRRGACGQLARPLVGAVAGTLHQAEFLDVARDRRLRRLESRLVQPAAQPLLAVAAVPGRSVPGSGLGGVLSLGFSVAAQFTNENTRFQDSGCIIMLPHAYDRERRSPEEDEGPQGRRPEGPQGNEGRRPIAGPGAGGHRGSHGLHGAGAAENPGAPPARRGHAGHFIERSDRRRGRAETSRAPEALGRRHHAARRRRAAARGRRGVPGAARPGGGRSRAGPRRGGGEGHRSVGCVPAPQRGGARRLVSTYEAVAGGHRLRAHGTGTPGGPERPARRQPRLLSNGRAPGPGAARCRRDARAWRGRYCGRKVWCLWSREASNRADPFLGGPRQPGGVRRLRPPSRSRN